MAIAKILAASCFGGLIGWLVVGPIAAGWGAGGRIVATVICVLVGLLTAALAEYRQFQRRQKLIQIARRHSLVFSEKGSQQIAERLKGMTNITRETWLEDVMQGGWKGYQVLLGDLRYATDQKQRVQTVVHFWGQSLYFPQFTLLPESRMLNFVSELTGIKDIDFPTHPEFSSSYHLSSSELETVRELFESDLLDYFRRHPGWEIRAGRDGIMMSRGTQMNAADYEGLFFQSHEILQLIGSSLERLIESGPEATNAPMEINTPRDIDEKPHRTPLRKAESTRGSTRVSDSADDEPASSWVARRVAASTVGFDEIDQFLRTPPPRKIPRKIVRQYAGNNHYAAYFFSFWLCLMGAMPISVGVIEMAKGKDVAPLIAMGCIPMLLGATVVIGTIITRGNKLSIIRDGIVVPAEIVAVEAPTTRTSGQLQNRIAKIRYSMNGQQRNESIEVLGAHIDHATDVLDRGERTPLLIDPSDSNRILLGLQLNQKYRIRF
jgi:hypothetical protein